MCAVHIWGLFLESSEKPVVKMHFACFEKLVFRIFFNVKNKKNKTIAKFGGSENYDTRKISGFFEKQAPPYKLNVSGWHFRLQKLWFLAGQPSHVIPVLCPLQCHYLSWYLYDHHRLRCYQWDSVSPFFGYFCSFLPFFVGRFSCHLTSMATACSVCYSLF